MTTLCETYLSQAAARHPTEALSASGVPHHQIRLLIGYRWRDRGAEQTRQASARSTRRRLRAANVTDQAIEPIIAEPNHGQAGVLAKVAQASPREAKRDSRRSLTPCDPARRQTSGSDSSPAASLSRARPRGPTGALPEPQSPLSDLSVARDTANSQLTSDLAATPTQPERRCRRPPRFFRDHFV